MSIGRVGNNQLTRELLGNIRGQMTHQERLFEQISSSKKILRPSDDPIGTGKSMNLNGQLQRLEEYETAISSAEVWTNVSAVALDSAVSTWKRVNELGIAAADGTKTAADRAGMAEELEQLLSGMVQISNTTHGGRYIFGGSQTDQPAFSAESDPHTGRVTGVFYQGNDAERKVKTSDHSSQKLNVLGSNAGNPDAKGTFVDSNTNVDLFKTMIELRDKLLNNDTIGISGSGGVLEKIEAGALSLTSAEVRLGGTQQILQLDRNRVIEQSTNTEQFLAEIEDADIAKLILELNNVQNTYEAALAAGGRLLQTGLINYI